MENNSTEPDAIESTKFSSPAAGRWTIRLALLLGLSALLLGGYLGYRLIYLQPFDVQAQVTREAIELSQQRVLSEVDAVMADARSSVSDLAAELEKQNRDVQQALESAVAKSLAEAKAERPTTPRQWRMAEAAFLLRMANYWLQFEGDLLTALNTLQRADEVLRTVQSGTAQDEYDLLPVRSELAQEILALQQVQRIDLQGIYLRLQALAQEVPPLRESLTLQETHGTQSEASESSLVQTIIDELQQFVRITNLADLGGFETPAASNAEAGPAKKLAARRALVAALGRAQVATLRRQQEAFQVSMQDALRAAAEMAPPGDPGLRSYVQQLAELAEQPLQANMPSISGSLTALNLLMETSE